LRHVKTPAGKPLVDGKNVTGFTNGEEADVGLTKVVPFLVEDELLGLGATYSKVKNWDGHTVKDGLLITGQNPASPGPAAKVLIDTLKAREGGGKRARGRRSPPFDFSDACAACGLRASRSPPPDVRMGAPERADAAHGRSRLWQARH